MLLETKRLYLREMCLEDKDDVDIMLKDEDIMYTYEHEFDDEDVKEWIDQNMERYKTHGLGMMAIIRKEDDAFIGQAGLSLQYPDNEEVIAIEYLLKKKYWKKGYAIEAARGLANFAFDNFKIDKLYAIIRYDNYPSKNVAKKLGMVPIKTIKMDIYGKEIAQELFVVDKETFNEKNNI